MFLEGNTASTLWAGVSCGLLCHVCGVGAGYSRNWGWMRRHARQHRRRRWSCKAVTLLCGSAAGAVFGGVWAFDTVCKSQSRSAAALTCDRIECFSFTLDWTNLNSQSTKGTNTLKHQLQVKGQTKGLSTWCNRDRCLTWRRWKAKLVKVPHRWTDFTHPDVLVQVQKKSNNKNSPGQSLFVLRLEKPDGTWSHPVPVPHIICWWMPPRLGNRSHLCSLMTPMWRQLSAGATSGVTNTSRKLRPSLQSVSCCLCVRDKTKGIICAAADHLCGCCLLTHHPGPTTAAVNVPVERPGSVAANVKMASCPHLVPAWNQRHHLGYCSFGLNRIWIHHHQFSSSLFLLTFMSSLAHNHRWLRKNWVCSWNRRYQKSRALFLFLLILWALVDAVTSNLAWCFCSGHSIHTQDTERWRWTTGWSPCCPKPALTRKDTTTSHDPSSLYTQQRRLFEEMREVSLLSESRMWCDKHCKGVKPLLMPGSSEDTPGPGPSQQTHVQRLKYIGGKKCRPRETWCIVLGSCEVH